MENDRKNREDSFGRGKHGVCFPVHKGGCVCVCTHVSAHTQMPQDGRGLRHILANHLPNTSFMSIFLQAARILKHHELQEAHYFTRQIPHYSDNWIFFFFMTLNEGLLWLFLQ